MLRRTRRVDTAVDEHAPWAGRLVNGEEDAITESDVEHLDADHGAPSIEAKFSRSERLLGPLLYGLSGSRSSLSAANATIAATRSAPVSRPPSARPAPRTGLVMTWRTLPSASAMTVAPP